MVGLDHLPAGSVSGILFVDGASGGAVRAAADDGLAVIANEGVDVVGAADTLRYAGGRTPEDVGVGVAVGAGADGLGDAHGAFGEPADVVALVEGVGVRWSGEGEAGEGEGEEGVELHCCGGNGVGYGKDEAEGGFTM